MTRWLPSFSVNRPVTVVMCFIALLVLGTIAWSRIPLEMMPGQFVLNKLWVWVPYADSTPRENDNALVQPVVEQLSTAPGISKIESRARSGNAQFTLEFHRSMDMDEAYNAVADRMERAMPDLPDDVDNYWIWKWDPSDEPILWSGISLPEDLDDPHRLVTDVVQKRLERIDGVGKVDVWGVDPKRVFVEFHLDRIQTHGVSLYDVIGRLGSDNFQKASGRIVDRGKVRYVRSLARYETLDTLRQTPIKEGVVLDDIATITHRVDLSASIAHIDGKDGAALAVNKESDANTVATAQAVQAELEAMGQDPAAQGAGFVTFFSQGELIQDSVDDLVETAMYGGLFAVVVLFAFLREWKMTLLIAGCIPFTLLLTVTVLFFTGGTLNLLSLMGLMLAVGMVVDNSIVVVESIYARRQDGEAAKPAAIEGTAEVALAITLSTLTTVVVFLPVILMSDDADFSFFMGELGMPVVYALLASLVVALLFTPLTTSLLRARRRKDGSEAPAIKPPPKWIVWLERKYVRGLRRVLTRRTDTLVAVLGFTMLTVIVPMEGVSCEDSDGNIGQFTIRYEVPGNFTYYERLEVLDRYEAFVEEHREDWGVRTHRSQLWSSSNNGRTHVYLLQDREGLEMSREAVIEQAKEELPQIAGVDAQIGWEGGGGPPPHQVRIVLRGEEMETLESLAAQVKPGLRTIPGVIGVGSDLEDEAGEEIRLNVDRDALAKYGMSAQRIGRTVSFAMRGTPLPDFHDGEDEVDVYARFRLQDRADMDRLLDFPLWSDATMSVVPLRATVEPEVAKGIGTIRREDRRTGYPLTIDLHQDLSKEEATARIGALLAGIDLPRGYSFDYGFELRDRAEDDTARNLAFMMSIIFVFLIMGVLFESFLLPLSIITSIPMAMIGVYWTLFLTGTSMDNLAGVGLVILVGVVVNNGIVLVDLVTRLREQGLERTEALIQAGARRLRPILMTALTTVCGLLPMATGSSSFVGMPYAPMGRVVAGGLVAGTVLTLFFVPFLYSVLDDMRQTGSRWFAWVVGKNASTGAVPGK